VRVRHTFWGPDLPSHDRVERLLGQWEKFVTFERSDNIERDAARLLASDGVLGWIQGRSEFGPRALGNRSILADPRPETNRDRVNKMVKQRETYRPFAPSIQTEHVREEYFDFPDTMPAPDFMVFTVPVRTEKRHVLGAVTHVDGTARIHSVDREVNPRYWRLLEEFKALTGVPVLLNTSFNNHAEPIVDSVQDALRCYLTTQIDHLVIDNIVVCKLDWTVADLIELAPSLVPSAHLLTRETRGQPPRHFAVFGYLGGKEYEMDEELYRVLHRADGDTTLRELGVGADSIG
jgi:predicted NodU family carbamoyl transferase